MKQPLFSLPRTLGLHAIVTFLVGIGCVYPLSLSLGLTAPVSLGVACCLLVTFLFAAFDCVPRFRALAYPALFLGIAALAIRYAGQVSAISAAIVLMVNGQSLALIAYSRAIVVLLSLLFTGVGASLARSDQAFFPLALVTIALLFVISFLGADVSATSLLPLVLALLISSRAQGVRTLRIVPCAALVLALTLRPRLLLLDEPHGPLDRVASLALSEELAAAAREGTAVLLSCHHDVPGLTPDLSLELADGTLHIVEA